MTPIAAGTVLCRTDDVGEGEARGFLPPDAAARVIVVRRAGRLLGWLDSCPHYSPGTPMAWRRDGYLDGDRQHLVCHAHGALFDIDSGRCLRGPPVGKGLTRVPLGVDADGNVVVTAALHGIEE